MNGLRVYTNTVAAGAMPGEKIFYSRRARGPFYKWLCDGEPAMWRCARVRLTEASIRTLHVETMKAVPAELRARLVEHYLE